MTADPLQIGLFFWGQLVPRTPKGKLYSKCGCEKQVDLACFHFLKIPGRDFGFFGKFILGEIPADTFTSHIRAERFNSRPLFSGQSHDILHRLIGTAVNDTYIVKSSDCLKDLSSNSV